MQIDIQRYKFLAPFSAALLMLMGSLLWGVFGAATLLGFATGSLSDPIVVMVALVAIGVTLGTRSALLSVVTCVVLGPLLTWYINSNNADFYREIGIIMTPGRFMVIASGRTFAFLVLCGLAWIPVQIFFKSDSSL